MTKTPPPKEVDDFDDWNPPRLHEDNAKYTGCKLGTVSTAVWIHEGEFPLEKGDTIWYSEYEHGTATVGRVIADPERRYLFIGVDANTPLLDDYEPNADD